MGQSRTMIAFAEYRATFVGCFFASGSGRMANATANYSGPGMKQWQ
jgi:hypothetical protein